MENQRFGIIWQLIKIHKLYFSVSLKNQPAIADTMMLDLLCFHFLVAKVVRQKRFN